MKCDVDHELISFAGRECPLCRVIDASYDVIAQFEQLFCEFEEKLSPSKTKKKAPKTKRKKGKLLHFRPRTAPVVQPEPA